MAGSGQPECRWIERGAGEPVLLLHGLLGNMYHWEAVLEGLAAACRPMALTLPLFAPALEAPSLAALGRHVIRFLDALGLARVVLGGNSLGGHVALRVALAHPERIAGLILTGSSGLFDGKVAGRAPHRPSSAYIRARMEEVFYDPALVTPGGVEAIRGLVTDRRVALRVLRMARAARCDNVEDRLGEVRVPALIVWGQVDRITPLELGRRFHARIADSQFWVLTHCGHAPMLEQPHAFGAIVREWLHETWPRRIGLVGAAVVAREVGPWSHVLDDPVRAVVRDPRRRQLIGRARHAGNAFGENVVLEEVERAVEVACRCAHAEVVEFTVAPRPSSPGDPRGGHDWLVEFAEPPRCPLDVFTRTLDETLMVLSAAYRDRRAGSAGMVAPRLVELPAGTFDRWTRGEGQLGHPREVPRITSDRSLADRLLASAALRRRRFARARPVAAG